MARVIEIAINLPIPMQLKPLADRVVVRPLEAAEKTKAGIIIPDTVEKESPEKGEVIAVGPGKLLENGQRAALSVKVGDKVMFKKYSPDKVKVDDKELLVIEESDILAILE